MHVTSCHVCMCMRHVNKACCMYVGLGTLCSYPLTPPAYQLYYMVSRVNENAWYVMRMSHGTCMYVSTPCGDIISHHLSLLSTRIIHVTSEWRQRFSPGECARNSHIHTHVYIYTYTCLRVYIYIYVCMYVCI